MRLWKTAIVAIVVAVAAAAIVDLNKLISVINYRFKRFFKGSFLFISSSSSCPAFVVCARIFYLIFPNLNISMRLTFYWCCCCIRECIRTAYFQYRPQCFHFNEPTIYGEKKNRKNWIAVFCALCIVTRVYLCHHTDTNRNTYSNG